MKRIVAFILTLALLVSVPVFSFAEEDAEEAEKTYDILEALRTDDITTIEYEYALQEMLFECAEDLTEREEFVGLLNLAIRRSIFDVQEYLIEDVLYNPKTFYPYSIKASMDTYDEEDCWIDVTIDFSAYNDKGVDIRYKDKAMRVSYQFDYETLDIELRIVKIADTWMNYDYSLNGYI